MSAPIQPAIPSAIQPASTADAPSAPDGSRAPATMRAVVRDVYGPADVLRTEMRAVPTPGPGMVRVAIRASSLNRADRYRLLGIPLPIRAVSGVFRPKNRGFGMDFSGIVDAVGPGVTGLSVGDAVYGEHTFGETWAEYACIPAAMVAPKPAALSHAEAACLPLAGVTALQGLRDHAGLKAGQHVLVNGASGAVGPFAVQIAKAMGATVTAVCSAKNAGQAHALGADRVLAYDTTDFTTVAPGGAGYDVVFDGVLNKPLSACQRVMHKNSVYLPVGGPEGRVLGPMVPLLKAVLAGLFAPQRVVSYTAAPGPDALAGLTALAESGAVKPRIVQTFGFHQAADAMRALQAARPSAKIVLSGWG